MARLLVLEDDGEETPFLRGILTHALQKAGLGFDESYEIASAVRDELEPRHRVTRAQIRKATLKFLRRIGDSAASRYAMASEGPPPIFVCQTDGMRVPYSRGRHRQSLEASGIAVDDAVVVSSALHAQLVSRGTTEVDIAELKRLTYLRLKRDLSSAAARAYAVWEDHRHGDRPLILLIGGTTGTGKSTVATRTAHLLDVVRTQSTDMLREVMRTMVPQRLVPALHVSSFRAWETLPVDGRSDAPSELLVEGYLRQSELLGVAAEAVVRRAATERVSVVLEGVHAHPNFLPTAGEGTTAHVVRVTLGVLGKPELERRIRGRGKHARERRAKRYMPHFDAIWSLQEFILSEADRAGVPIVVNDDVDAAAREVAHVVMRQLLAAFDGDERAILS